MGDFYIRQTDELYHYGIKGMKWGIRHDPERTGRQSSGSRKKMSTAKKVAIGVAVAAAVGGVSYVAITRKNNKAASAARQKALRVMRKYSSAKVKRGPGKLTGGTNKRYTQFGASVSRKKFYDKKAQQTPLKESYFMSPGTDKKRHYESLADKAYVEGLNMIKANNHKTPNMYNTSKINKLRRQKGPKALRYK